VENFVNVLTRAYGEIGENWRVVIQGLRGLGIFNARALMVQNPHVDGEENLGDCATFLE